MRLSNPLYHSATWPCELRDFPEWHRGRPRYGVWLLLIEQPEWLAYFHDMQHRLRHFLHPQTQRQAHTTLFVCGFPQAEQRFNDDVQPAKILAQHQRLYTAQLSAFNLLLDQVDAFPTIAFLSLKGDLTPLDKIRETLNRECAELRFAPFVPHITLGLFRDVFSAETLREAFAQLPPPPAVPCTFQRVDFATYSAQETLGPLRIEHSVTLHRK